MQSTNASSLVTKEIVPYREDIDALRGISILSVFFYHLFPEFIPGGFLGVDIFFVISGFLISKIIFSKLNSNSFSFIDFYRRRINRIFPALIILILLCFSYGFLVLFPDEFISLGKQVEGAALFISNHTLYKETGYFDLSAEYKPLLHLWSLAVEEQFYLIWPIILFLSYKITSRPTFQLYRSQIIITGILIIILVSFLTNVYFTLWTEKQKLAFYFTGPRIWEITIGSLGAYYSLYIKKGNISKYLFEVLSFLSFIFIFFSLFFLDHTNKYLSLLIGFPLVSVLFLLVFYQNPSLFFRKHKILSNRLLVFIGLISYPIYLLHWPLISYSKILFGKNIDLSTTLLIFTSAVLLAYGIYRYIERPIRKENSTKTAVLLWSILLILGVFGHLSAYRFVVPYVNYLFPKTIIDDWKFPTPNMKGIEYQGKKGFHKVGDSDKIVLFFSDSNAEQYGPRIDKLITENDNSKSAVFATSGGLCPLPNVGRNDSDIEFVQNIMDYANSPEVQTVVIAGIWTSYLSDTATNYLYGTKGHLHLDRNLADDFYLQKALHDLEEFIVQLIQKGKKVYIITNIPIGDDYDPKNLFSRNFMGKWTFDSLKTGDREKWDKSYLKTKNILLKISQNTGATLIDPSSFLCTNQQCLVCTPNGTAVYKDGNHLAAGYVKKYLTILDFLFTK